MRAANRRILCAAVPPILALLLVAGAAAARTPVVLHPAVGESVDRAEASRWGLFPGLPDLVEARFLALEAGGYLACIELAGEGDDRLRERFIPRDVWEGWRARLEAGEPVDGIGDPPPADAGAVWPEIALPESPPAPPLPAAPDTLVRLSDSDWITLVDLGYKHSTTRFGDYFTDMLLLGVAVGKPVNAWLTPTLGIQFALGDLQDDFEAATANGKSAHYAFELGLQAHALLSERTGVYLGIAGGYYIRSLRWGGTIYYSYYDVYETGSLVREQSDWGGAARAGLRWRLSPRGARPRLLDLSVRYESYSAERSVLVVDSETGAGYTAEDRDVWLSVSLGLVVGL